MEIRCRTLKPATIQGRYVEKDEGRIHEPVRVSVILDEGLGTERFLSFDLGDDLTFIFQDKDCDAAYS